MARAALAAAEAGPGRKSQNRNRAAALLKEATTGWPGGANTARGLHYRREMDHFVARHGYDPAFAKLPRSGSAASSGRSRSAPIAFPRWAYGFIFVAISVAIRSWNSAPSSSYRPSSPSWQDFPGYKPQTGPGKIMTPEERERIEKAADRIHEMQQRGELGPWDRKAPFPRPRLDSDKSATPPGGGRPPGLQLKY